MSGYPVTCIHFADKDAMLDASLVIGQRDDALAYLCDHNKLYLTLKTAEGAKAAKWLAEGGIPVVDVVRRDADVDEVYLFESMRDDAERYYPDDEPDGTYVRAWGGIMV